MITATDAADLSILEAATLLRARTVSAVELLAACQRRIDERNGGPPTFDGLPATVNAWARLYPERAREHAEAADRRLWREGADAPVLCGIPLGLKDLIAVGGLPLTASSRVLSGHVAERDALVWSRLRAAGMVLLGHTHTHEFAVGETTDQVGNPYAVDRSAGGSSGGSAAALAAGMVPAALGTDTAGSVRLPAALSGVCALKPTHGRVPLAGTIPLARTLDHIGPMARTMADCAVLLDALSCGGGERTPLMPPPATPSARPESSPADDRSVAGIRIARTDRPDDCGLDADTAEALERAARACRDAGAEVVELPAPAAFDADAFSTVLFSEVHAFHERFRDRERDYRPSTREFVDFSRLFTSAQHYIHAQQWRARLVTAWEDWFVANRVDMVLEPTTPTTAPVRGDGYEPGSLGGHGDPLVRLTAMWNATGFPVAALPVCLGSRTGLPVGMSLIGVRGAEQTVLSAATSLQGTTLPPLGAVRPRRPQHRDAAP